MNKGVWIAGIIVIAIALGSAYLYSVHESRTASTAPATSGNASVGATGASTVITYSDSGFVPTPQTVSPGTTVTWLNKSSHQMWIEASGASAADCTATPSRTTLNECASVASGGSFSFTFTVLGTVPYRNHEQLSDAGSVIVTDASSSGPINPASLPN